MMMKNSKVKKIELRLDSDSTHTEYATTSSDILKCWTPCQLVSLCDQMCHKVQSQGI